MAAVEVEFRNERRVFTPEQISAAIIAHLKAAAEGIALCKSQYHSM
jgi:molecular chaperone DnaK (HSP70)